LQTIRSVRSKKQVSRKKAEPIRPGIQLVKKRERSIDWVFLLIVLVLLAFGMVMVFSASYANALAYKGDSFYYIKKHAMFVVAGIVAMVVLSKFPPYTTYQKLSTLIYVAGLCLMALVVVLNGGKPGRWINLPLMGSFQPSELMKIAVIIIFAALISKNYQKITTFRYGILPFILVLLPVIGILVVFQHHLSATIIICTIGLGMVFIAGAKMRYFVSLIPAGALALVGLVLFKGADYMQERVHIWLDPFADIQDSTWQTVQSLVAIGSGGVMGLGLGGSRQKYLYLPEPQNDFIFAIVCEELGLIGAILVILLFVLLIYRGFVIASKAPNKFSAMLVIGIVLQIAIQAFLNIAVVTNSIPNTGISLPFFSAGGTALVTQMMEVGIVLNVSRYAMMEKV
jgi:cell division protein FtsW